jgi:hypothetical protein
MPSKIGIHGIRPDGIGNLIEQVNAAGAHVATIKAVDDLGWLTGIKDLSPETITVGRSNTIVVFNMNDSPAVAARNCMDRILPTWEANRRGVDYWEVFNEMAPPTIEGHVKIADTLMHCMDIAEAEGYKLALFSYSMGVPEFDQMAAISETGVFGRAKQGGHILALHEYGEPIDVYFGHAIPPHEPHPERGALACRYRWWYDLILVPRDEVIPLVITEAGTTRGMNDLGLTPREWVDQVIWYDERLREDPYVIGCHLFTIGPVNPWHGFDYEDALELLGERIIALKDEPDTERLVDDGPSGGGVIIDDDEEEETMADKPRVEYERHYFLLPPDTTWEWIEACREYWEKFHVTVGGSADDAGWGPGLKARMVTAVNPQLWPTDLKAFLDEFYAGCTYDPIQVDSPAELKAILDRRAEEGKRLG